LRSECLASVTSNKLLIHGARERHLTKKAEPPPTRDVNRDSGTASANGGWLRRLVRCHGHINSVLNPSADLNLVSAGIIISKRG
jgi:hypothetical protein